MKILRDEYGTAIGTLESLGTHAYLDLKADPKYKNFDSVKIIHEENTGEDHTLLSSAHLDEVIEDVNDHPLHVTKEIVDDKDITELLVTYKFIDNDGNYFTIRTAEPRMEDIEYTDIEVIEDAEFTNVQL